MKLPFVKMHGLGNDYIYLDAVTTPSVEAMLEERSWKARVRAMSARHSGIGADGVIVICHPKRRQNHARMRMFNADGSDGRMCGNGARCVAKFAHGRLGLGNLIGADRVGLSIESASGVLTVEATLVRGDLDQIRVDMGKPVLGLKSIGVDAKKLAFKGVAPHWGVQQDLGPDEDAPSVCLIAVFVSMGNPHMVVMEHSFGEFESLTEHEVAEVPLNELGPLFENHPAFADRMNVHFASVQSTGGRVGRARTFKGETDGGLARIVMRSWERGAGETLACASGACAALVAGAISGRCGREAIVEMPGSALVGARRGGKTGGSGGGLLVRWDAQTGHVTQTGPATEVFEGVWAG